MLHLMKNVGAELNYTMESMYPNEKTKSFCIDVKELCTRYAIDVIASCAYGIEANSLKYPNGDFVKNGKKIFEFKILRALEFFGVFFFPEVVPMFRFKVVFSYAPLLNRKTYHSPIRYRFSPKKQVIFCVNLSTM